MPRTVITPVPAPGSNIATGTVVPFVAADVANSHAARLTGKEMLIAFNSGGSTYTVTINSVADPYGRVQDIAADPITAGQYKIYGPFPLTGWQQADGNKYFQASNAAVKLAVVQVP